MDLAVTRNNLPETIEDLTKFALIGREKLTAVRAEIRAIDKLKLANDVKQQKLLEAQDIAETVLDAETRIGELLRVIPERITGRPTAKSRCSAAPTLTPKQQAQTEIGISRDQAKRFMKLAENKSIVEQAKAEVRERDDIVSRDFGLRKIDETKKPHIAQNSGNNEWYTPKEYIDAARTVMGNIDLDPASSDIANEIVGADTYYTAEDDGLSKNWHGRVWMNPPYSADMIQRFIEKLNCHTVNGDISQAIVLVNNATETAWFGTLISVASAIVFPQSRVKFYMPDGKTGAPLQGQAVVYIGDNPLVFMDVFCPFGWGAFLREG